MRRRLPPDDGRPRPSPPLRDGQARRQARVSSLIEGSRWTPQRIRRSLAARGRTLMWNRFERSKPVVLGLAGARPVGHVFVFGCQRSGTTHVERLFRADPRSAVFGEFSALSVDDDRTAWRALHEVARDLKCQRATYTVARSLLASHRAVEILDAVTPSVGLFLFRDVDGVVNSMVRKWGDGFRALSERVETGADGVWDLRDLWERIEGEADAAGNGDPDQRTRDSYALYWYARNALVLDEDVRGRLLLVDYADMAAAPAALVERALAPLGLDPPRVAFPLATREPSGTRRSVPLSPSIRARCDRLYAHLRMLKTALV